MLAWSLLEYKSSRFGHSIQYCSFWFAFSQTLLKLEPDMHLCYSDCLLGVCDEYWSCPTPLRTLPPAPSSDTSPVASYRHCCPPARRFLSVHQLYIKSCVHHHCLIASHLFSVIGLSGVRGSSLLAAGRSQLPSFSSVCW